MKFVLVLNFLKLVWHDVEKPNAHIALNCAIPHGIDMHNMKYALTPATGNEFGAMV